MNKYLEKIFEKQASDSSELLDQTYPSGIDRGNTRSMSAHADIKKGRDVRPHKSYLQRALAGKNVGTRYIPRFK